jgi:NAD+ diphosphatase
MKSANYYAAGELDRVSHLRQDDVWLAERLADPTTCFAPVWQLQNLFATDDEQQPVFLAKDVADAVIADEVVLLGIADGKAYFALDFSNHEEPPLGDHGVFCDLRAVGALLTRQTGSILAYARGIVYWHIRHQFCGECGSPTISRQAGHLRICSNTECGASCFPRTDPAVIMLVHDGERILMGRQNRWPPGMHSVLAGFVEPGESLEGAVAREIFEEAGIEVTDIRYHSSQPWPFPASIMLGFTARAVTTGLVIDHTELEDARWYSREDLVTSPEDESFRLPRKDSIARRLVDDWLGT